MKQIVFILDKQSPAEVYAACGEACLHFRAAGLTGAVCTAEEALPFRTEDADTAGTLFVCDDPDRLRTMREQGFAVIALQHAGNASEKFPGAAYVFSEPEEVDLDSYVKAWQRLRGLPWDILETKRLKLRETTTDDLDALYEIYAMPGMTDYMEGLFPDPADERRYLSDYIRNVYGLLGFGVWTVLEKETGDVIGRCGFSMRNGFERIELGFLIGTRWQNRGYAQEACRAALRYGRDFLGIDTVQALVKEGNDVSVHILENLGFVKNGIVNAEEDIDGRTYPAVNRQAKPARSPYILFVKETSNMVS